jgi:hypothetical protein
VSLARQVMAQMANDYSHGDDEERRGGGALTSTQVHTWLAWRGSAHAADQARPEENFTGGGIAAQGAPNGDASTCATRSPSTPQKHNARTMRVTIVAA